VVHITEVSEDTQRGLSCGCICSECGDPLVARLGKVRQRHFAHHTKHSCTSSDESALHRFAKEVFRRQSKVMVPDAEVWWGLDSLTVARAQYVHYSEAILEKSIGSICPDVTLVREGDKPPLLVEIVVTHAVDDEKEAQLRSLGLPCLEIDLSELHVGLDAFDREGIERLLIHEASFEKNWVCFPGEEEHLARLQEKRRLADEEHARKKREKQEWLARSEAARRKLQDDLIAPEHVAKSNARKEAELADHPMWRRNSAVLGITADSIPYYLNEPLDGEYLFECHRSIWQSTLFIAWVLNKRDPARSRDIHIKYAAQNLYEKNPELLVKDLYWAFRDHHDIESVATVVGHYFRSLVRNGFVERHPFAMQGRNPYTWVYHCLRPEVVRLPPEYNSQRYRIRGAELLDIETGEVISLPSRPAEQT